MICILSLTTPRVNLVQVLILLIHFNKKKGRASSSTDAKGSDCHVTPLQKQKCTRNETPINTSSTVQFLTKQTSDMSFNTCKHDILLHSEKLYKKPCTDVPKHDSLQLENSTSTNDPHSSATVYTQKGKKLMC